MIRVTMARMTQQPVPVNFNINLPPEQFEGHYADFATIWHNQETFILDFVATAQPPQVGEDDNGNQVAQINCQIVTRVRIPASQCWEVMRGLERQLTAWEHEQQAMNAAQDPPTAPPEEPPAE